MSENLTKLIEAEESKILGLEKKKAGYDEKSKELAVKIKECKERIDKYKITKDAEKHAEFQTKLMDSGLSFEDVMMALKEGDMLSLQEKMEANQKTNEADNFGADN